VNFRVEKRWRGEAIALELQSHKPRKHTSQSNDRPTHNSRNQRKKEESPSARIDDHIA
jgi:hypothetical protein